MGLQRLVLAATLVLAACTAPGVREVQQHPDLPRRHELTATPFFPQDRYQCGPAALATVLTAAGLPVAPDRLTPEVYLPSRQGSLQIEMLAAARRHGAVAVRIPPRLDALLKEVAAGHGVLVLQNLGLSWIPTWHYAVVIGYDLDAGLVWLRSGTTRRQEMSLNTFQHTWERSDHWAFVALQPGDLPATAELDDVIGALVAYEKTAPAAAAQKAYAAATKRWPDNLVLLMGLGNTAYAAADQAAAATAFRKAIAAHPTAAAAHNNLANVLLAQGLYREAQASAEQALAVVGQDARLKGQVLDTLRDIATRRAAQAKPKARGRQKQE